MPNTPTLPKANHAPRSEEIRLLSSNLTNQSTPRARDLITSIDWSRTPTGPRDRWPSRLTTLVETILANRIPMIVLWGRELTQIYNDAYAQLIGGKHPAAMGAGNLEIWPEVRHINEPIYQAVRTDARDVYFEDALYPLERNGQPEEVYLTISYSPVLEEDNSVGGILVTMLETTRKVIDERRLRSLNELALRTARARSIEDVGRFAADVLRGNRADIPFALIYANVVGRDGQVRKPRQIGNVGLEDVSDDHLGSIALHGRAGGGVIDLPGEGGPYPGGTLGGAAHSAYVAPLPVVGRAGPLGGVVLGMSAALTTDSRYVEYLQTVASQLAAAFENATVFSREHRIADTLQRAALPGDLPQLDGLLIDAVYEPGQDDASIGGDWYDIFALGDGRVVISIGDVAGSGVAAAAAMGAARQMIRALVHVEDDPCAVLDAVDKAFRAEHPQVFVTAFLGVLDRAHEALRYCSAGHPPPLLRHAGGRVDDLYRPALPIGLRHLGESASGSVALPAGATLVLFTDGLTEAGRDAIEGERVLRETIAGEDFARSTHPAAFIRDRMLGRSSNDDVAILVVRRTPAGP